MAKNSRYLMDKDSLNTTGLELLGYSKTIKAHGPLDLHTHPDCIEMVFLLKGSEIYHVNDEEFVISRGQVFFTLPNELHDTGAHPQGISEFIWMHLNPSVKDGFLGLHSEHSQLLTQKLLNIKDHILYADKEILSLVHKSFTSFQAQTYEGRMFGLSLLVGALYKLVYFPDTGESPNFAIQRILAYIEDHITDAISLEELCDYGNLSLSTLQHQFKEYVGQSPRDYINYQKIEHAKKLFKRGASVTEVAMRLSFSSSDYFSTTFKKYTAQTPSEYINGLSKVP